MLLIFGLLFMVFIFVVVGLFSGMLLFFIDLPSASLILLSLFFFLVASKSGRVVGRYIKTSFTKDYPYTKAELEGLSAAIKNTIKLLMATGGFGFFTGIIASLAHLGNKQALGPNLAISLLTVLYAIALSFFVFFPTQAWAENKLKDM